MFFIWFVINMVFIITGVFLVGDNSIVGWSLVGVGIILMFLWFYSYSKRRRRRRQEGDDCALDALIIDCPEAIFSKVGKECGDGDCGGLGCDDCGGGDCSV